MPNVKLRDIRRKHIKNSLPLQVCFAAINVNMCFGTKLSFQLIQSFEAEQLNYLSILNLFICTFQLTVSFLDVVDNLLSVDSEVLQQSQAISNSSAV